MNYTPKGYPKPHRSSYNGLSQSQKANVQRMWPDQDPELFSYDVNTDGGVDMCYPVLDERFAIAVEMMIKRKPHD